MNNVFDGRPLFRRFLALAFILLFFYPASPTFGAETDGGPDSAVAGELKKNFLNLKRHFENEAAKAKDQQVLNALAVETAAQSWAFGAAFLGARGDNFEAKKAAFARNLKSKDWDAREMAALELYYEAASAMTWKIINNNGQALLLAELEAINGKTAEKLAGLSGKPDAALEERVILSGALASITAVAVKSVGGGAMEQPIQIIVREMLEKANAVSERPDIHYRAKLSLLYANNVHGLTALMFLLGHNAGPPLSTELAAVHNIWSGHVREASLPDALSLTWTAQCQAALPLAYWLATH